ncbi:RHS repeat domain-containing protein [Metapseudomonas furukawaii]|uniref:RHS repeat domain-containing protein n=1 Tax=Metapseudomonas furukawaii TaxID=1149133 RepID=UPI0006862F31|nr:RHS repeat-associated core domain-containing protein [Pseudomonas furukawaii]
MEFLVGRLITSVLALLLLGSTQAATLVFTTYYHNDHLGSPAAATDERNELLWRAHYRPYGERQENPADTPYGSPGYTGHVQDGSSGLVYMQARYYDPQLGRFLAMDPAGPQEEVPGSFNRYAYGLNNPYRYVDPDGHWAMAVLVGLDIGLTGHGIYSEYQTGGTDAALVEAGKAAAAHVIGLGVGNVLRRGYILAKGANTTENVANLFKAGRTAKASELRDFAKNQGWKSDQTDGGPLKFIDENGIARLTIKKGSPRAPGSSMPHVEFKDPSGQRTGPLGNPVTRKSAENHTKIDFDL